MAHQRRAGKGVRHDIINVTEIDDELDEFSLSGGASSNKGKATVNGHVKPKYTDPLSTNSYKDPLKSMNVKDPFKEKRDLNSVVKNKMPESALNYDSIFNNKTTQSSLTVKSGITQSSSLATSSKTTTTTPVTSSITSSRGFGSSSTQLTRNQQFTSTQASKRNNAPTRINKNQKGFSHEEKDLYIDDIEDF